MRRYARTRIVRRCARGESLRKSAVLNTCTREPALRAWGDSCKVRGRMYALKSAVLNTREPAVVKGRALELSLFTQRELMWESL